MAIIPLTTAALLTLIAASDTQEHAPEGAPGELPAPTVEAAARPAEDPAGLRLGGELKVLWNGFDDFGPAPAFPGVVLVQFASARLTAEGELAPWARLDAHLAVESASWNVSLPLFAALGADAIIVTAPQALPLQADLTGLLGPTERLQVRLRTDRLNVRLGTERASVTLGRQPLALGFASLFPVLGQLTPVPATALEREYVPGMDAVTVAYAPMPELRLKLVYALGGEWGREGVGALAPPKARVALTAETTLHDVELVLVSSVLRGMPFFGAGARRQLGAWQVGGEVAYAHERTPFQASEGFSMATVSVGHRFDSGLSLMAEAAYYGFGASDAADYPAVIGWSRVQQGDLPFYFGRLHAGVVAQYPLGERFVLGLNALGSLQDGSGVLIPSVALTSGGKVVATLSGWLPFGRRTEEPMVANSEYSLAAAMVGMEVRHYF